MNEMCLRTTRIGVFPTRWLAGTLEGFLQQQLAGIAGIGKNGQLLARIVRSDGEVVEVKVSTMNTDVDKGQKEPNVSAENNLTTVFMAVGTNIIDNEKIVHSGSFRDEEFNMGYRVFKCINNEETERLRNELKGCVDACYVTEPEWM